MDSKKIRQLATDVAQIAADVGGRFWHDLANELDRVAASYEQADKAKGKKKKADDEDG